MIKRFLLLNHFLETVIDFIQHSVYTAGLCAIQMLNISQLWYILCFYVILMVSAFMWTDLDTFHLKTRFCILLNFLPIAFTACLSFTCVIIVKSFISTTWIVKIQECRKITSTITHNVPQVPTLWPFMSVTLDDYSRQRDYLSLTVIWSWNTKVSQTFNKSSSVYKIPFLSSANMLSAY